MFYPKCLFFLYALIAKSTAQHAGFTPDFHGYLLDTVGQATLNLLERKEHSWGSFGGKLHPDQEIRKQPVLMVHGVATTAGRFLMLRKYLYNKGYTDAELYATTWGNGPQGGLVLVKMECRFVRQIRIMIDAIHEYTGSRKIDIVAFSMGAPITRKAILGGDCNGIYLGKPLTHLVDTFVSVAGANYGSAICEMLPLAICNLNNGLSCRSHRLSELNSRKHRYEGKHSFSITTTNDEKVGGWCCGHKCASLPNNEAEFVYHGPGHDEVLYRSIKLQYDLITKHRGKLSDLQVSEIPIPPARPRLNLFEYYFAAEFGGEEADQSSDSLNSIFYQLATECLAVGGLWSETKSYDYDPPENDHVKTFDHGE
ncbi:unnamed protein product, partial [Mesorhabditis spiculigera]